MAVMRIALAVLRLVLALTLGTLPVVACRHFQPGTVGGKIVDCASKAIREKGLVYLGRVNDVIGNTQLSDGEANSRLINLGVDAGQDVIGCLMADQGVKFAESARENPNDVVSATAARRAERRRAELEREGWRFEGVP